MAEEQTLEPPHGRARDGGPIYTETPPEIRANQPYSKTIAEPWNTATAFLFVVIVVFWVARLRGRLKQYPFLAISLLILLIGGIGGTLYHGLRNWIGFFLMDVVPIWVLGLIVSVYWWIRLGPRMHHLLVMLVVLVFLHVFGWWQLPPHWSINLSYASLALLILVPLGIILFRTRCRHAGWVATAFVSFGIAWFCRLADVWNPPLLPMGTHWLWHTFGAITTAALTEYVYRIEGVSLRKRENSSQEINPRIGSP
jgi:hypothetical protein